MILHRFCAQNPSDAIFHSDMRLYLLNYKLNQHLIVTYCDQCLVHWWEMTISSNLRSEKVNIVRANEKQAQTLMNGPKMLKGVDEVQVNLFSTPTVIHQIHPVLSVRVFLVSHQLFILGCTDKNKPLCLINESRIELAYLMGERDNIVESRSTGEPLMAKWEVCLFDSCIHFREIVSLFLETESLTSLEKQCGCQAISAMASQCTSHL